MLELNCNKSPHHMTLIKDHWTAWKGVKINFHSSTSWIIIGVKSFPLYIPTLFWSFFISPDEDLLFEVETSWVNFFASFNTDDPRKIYVSNVSKSVILSFDYEKRWGLQWNRYKYFHSASLNTMEINISGTVGILQREKWFNMKKIYTITMSGNDSFSSLGDWTSGLGFFF